MVKLLSFVVPVKDEMETLEALTTLVFDAVDALGTDFDSEIIFVDDGSKDGSWIVIGRLAELHPGKVRAVQFRRNLGKALALEVGFRQCRGEFVFTMDADLQDDPKEIPKFLGKLEEGYDLVSGWKRTRHDPLSKTIPSRLFNGVTAWMTGLKLNDFNCGFKCYRFEVVENLHIYGELHRYIPVLAADMGYLVGEVEVQHHPRMHGRSKYGWERYLRGFIDLLTVLATTRWLVKPGHLFGGVGLGLGLAGGGCLVYMFGLWLFGSEPIGGRPLLTFGVLSVLASLQMISLGVMAEFHVKSMPIDLDRYVSKKIDVEAVAVNKSHEVAE